MTMLEGPSRNEPRRKRSDPSSETAKNRISEEEGRRAEVKEVKQRVPKTMNAHKKKGEEQDNKPSKLRTTPRNIRSTKSH